MPLDRPPRIVYSAGPGDVIGTYRHFTAGFDDPAQVAITYSGQFYDYCRQSGASALVISSHPNKEKFRDGNLRIEHRPIPFQRGPGALYHLATFFSGIRLLISAVKFRADIVIVTVGSPWFVLGLIPWFGIKVVPTLHCVMWPKNARPTTGVDGMIHRLNARFFRRSVLAVLSLSSDITDQLHQMVKQNTVPIFPFLPTYRPESFGDGFGTPPPAPPFRVFFAGRIEGNKGVFDLLAIAQRFAAEGHTDVEFDLCGDGSRLQDLRKSVLAAGLQNRFRCHGHTTKAQMREMYEKCHVVIVPTTSNFVEGFNKVVAEGVLAGRPVITSSVCPALEYVREAVVEVPPDQPAAYGDAILKLKNDLPFYQSKRQGTTTVRKQFYDIDRGWKSAVARAVNLL